MDLSGLKQNRKIRKLQLDAIAREIKIIKNEIKSDNRKMDGIVKEYQDLHKMTITDGAQKYTHDLENLRKEWGITRIHCALTLYPRYRKLRRQYRCLHIIYCLYGGTPIEQIEPRFDHEKYTQDTIEYIDDISLAYDYQKMYKGYIESKSMV